MITAQIPESNPGLSTAQAWVSADKSIMFNWTQKKPDCWHVTVAFKFKYSVFAHTKYKDLMDKPDPTLDGYTRKQGTYGHEQKHIISHNNHGTARSNTYVNNLKKGNDYYSEEIAKMYATLYQNLEDTELSNFNTKEFEHQNTDSPKPKNQGFPPVGDVPEITD